MLYNTHFKVEGRDVRWEVSLLACHATHVTSHTTGLAARSIVEPSVQNLLTVRKAWVPKPNLAIYWLT